MTLNNAINAGLPISISNGGTGHTTANAAFNALSPNTTKGDITVFSSTNARLPVGTDTYVLTADSSQTLGVKWAPASSSGYNLVQNNGTPLTARTTLNFAATGLIAADDAVNSVTKVTLNSGISGWSGFNTNGILTQTANNTFTARTITGTSGTITVTNGTGVSGDPTLTIDSGYVGQTSITTLGTVSSGTWNGSVVAGQYGGTGVNNSGKTITLGGNLTTSGAFATTLTVTGATNVTLPTSGTLVNSAVTSLSSLATVGTITSGTWNGSVVTGTYGGTGVNNGSNTITLGGNLTTSGAFATTLTVTGATNVTLPTSGTLVNTSVTSLSSLATVGTITSGTWSSNLQTYTETNNASTQSSSYAINLNNGNVHSLTLSGNVTLSFSNVPASNATSVTLFLIQDATGSRTVTWPASVIWPGGTAPTLTTTANHVDTITMITTNAGTTWRAFVAGLNFAS